LDFDGSPSRPADQKAKARILTRLLARHMEISAIANQPGQGVSEMRVHVGAGYRCLRSRVAQDKLLRTIEREFDQPHSPL